MSANLPPEIQARMLRSGAQASGPDHALFDGVDTQYASDLANSILANPVEPMEDAAWRWRWGPDIRIRPSDIGDPKSRD